jgi:hypothetical protein
MKILICKWGLLKFHPLLRYYVDFEWIQNAIQNEQYIISIWFFKHLPKIFKNSYVLYYEDGVKDNKDVKKLIKKLESVEGIKISDEKKQEIYEKANEQDIFVTADIDAE